MMKLHASTSSSLSIKMATTGGSIMLPNLNLNFPSSPYCSRDPKWSSSSLPLIAAKFVISHRNAVCYAESSAASTVAAETKEEKEGEPTEPASRNDTAAPAKAKPPAKAPAKALPEMMEEDVIPSLRSTLEKQQDIKELQLFFKDNKLEGSFLKKGIPYTFWALFPDGNITGELFPLTLTNSTPPKIIVSITTGPKGFSLSSYGSTASNVEPFLVDEKKVTAKLLVFWVEKRLAAQGIIPVWTD